MYQLLAWEGRREGEINSLYVVLVSSVLERTLKDNMVAIVMARQGVTPLTEIESIKVTGGERGGEERGGGKGRERGG